MRPTPDFMKAIMEGAAPALLIHVEHPDGDAYFWEGVGELEYGGATYRGAGLIGTISQTKKSAEIRIDEIRMTLNALQPDEVSKLSDDVKNRVVTIDLAAVTDTLKVKSVYRMDEILLDYQIDKISADLMSSIELVGQSGFWTLERPTEAAYSQEEQELQFPDDTGMSLIPALRNKDIPWNKEAPA